MNTQSLDKKNWALLMIGYFSAGYFTLNWVASQYQGTYTDVALALDHAIPFIPIFILGYILVFGSILLALIIIKHPGAWYKMIIGFFISSTLCYLFFLILPVQMTMRPDLAHLSDSGIFALITQFYYIIDLPYNCFPSLHVNYPVLITLTLWHYHPRLRWVFLSMAIIVALSVLLVKQHYIADAVAGTCTAILAFIMATRIYARYGGMFKNSDSY